MHAFALAAVGDRQLDEPWHLALENLGQNIVARHAIVAHWRCALDGETIVKAHAPDKIENGVAPLRDFDIHMGCFLNRIHV